MGCTPLGLWLYSTPSITVSRVRVDAEAQGRLPVVVALDVLNPNDYALSTTRLELKLSLDDFPIGRLDRDSSVSLLPQGTATVALPLEADRSTPPDRLQRFRSGMHRFNVRGRATVATPFGKQKIRFAQEGDLVFGSPASPASAPADPAASPSR